MAHTNNNRIPCYKALNLLNLHLWNDPSLTDRDRAVFKNHLQHCHKCAKEYEDAKWVLGLVKKYATPEDFRQITTPKVEAPKALNPKFNELDKQKRRKKWLNRKRNKNFKWAGTVAAMAACVTIAVCMSWNIFTGRKNSADKSLKNLSKATSPLSNASFEAVAELITPQGKTPLQFNQQIKAGDSPQEILLGGMHRVVMAPSTTAMFTAEPVYTETERGARHAIQLSKGEIYVEVVPGHPFTVKTDNALLRITGTKFNVTADSNETKLTLLKGSIQFSNQSDMDDFVEVKAGYSSSIKGQSLPTSPVHSNAFAATAWARDFIMRNTLAHAQPGLGEDFLESIRDSWMQNEPPNLDKIDYQQWREEHRDWFQKQFPWIFEIQKFLNEEHSTEVDYIELLMISGDIWQFNYPRSLGKPIPIFDPAVIERIAKHYRVDSQQLLKAVNALFKPLNAKHQPTTTESSKTPSEVFLSALKDWQSAITSATDNPNGLPTDLLLFNLRAGTYLSNARTSAYLWIKENPKKAAALLANERYRSEYLSSLLSVELKVTDALVECLAHQVAAVRITVKTVQELFVAPKGAGCERQVATLGKQLSQYISAFLTAKRDER